MALIQGKKLITQGTSENIQITIPVTQIQQIINQAITSQLHSIFFGPARYSQPAGPGYTVIENKIIEWAKEVDLTSIIEKLAMQSIQSILPEAVDKAIKNRAGSILAELVRSGDLDDRISTAIESRYANKRRLA